MPLTLNPEQLWEKVKKQQGKIFHLIETKRQLTIVTVVNNGVTIADENGKKGRLHRSGITEFYAYVGKHGKYTRADFKAVRIKGYQPARIIALLAFVVPEEIESFTQDEGEVCYGTRLRGIRARPNSSGSRPLMTK